MFLFVYFLILNLCFVQNKRQGHHNNVHQLLRASNNNNKTKIKITKTNKQKKDKNNKKQETNKNNKWKRKKKKKKEEKIDGYAEILHSDVGFGCFESSLKKALENGKSL